jgi:hypothetical protein
MLQAHRVGASSGEWEVTTDEGKVVMKTYPAISNEEYRLYQET